MFRKPRENRKTTIQGLFTSTTQTVAVGLIIIGTFISTLNAQVSKNLQIIDTTIGLSKVRVLCPSSWNGRTLIYAHGLRAEGMALTADISPTGKINKTLLDSGWIVATTSYRRNGWIINEAIDDIDSLRVFIQHRFGKPKHIFLHGASMGGEIVTIIAESPKGKYAGIVANGAALNLDTTNRETMHSYKPIIPLLFISNQNELSGPKLYIERCKGKSKPALWYVKRDGHCNTTEEEDLAAINAICAKALSNKELMDKDATNNTIKPGSSAVFSKDQVRAIVSSIHSSYGNISTYFVEEDLTKINIKIGSYYSLRFKDKEFKTKLGSSFFDVPQGEWVSFITAEGYLLIARNFANAGQTLGCVLGDTITIKNMEK